ncbi:MAG: 3-methyl-2-oxobutanoate dehydrogenase subunit beta [Myxococcota bacterium]
MSKLNQKFDNDLVPQDELMYSGNVACPGCGATLSMRIALKALGPKTAVVIPACCWSIIAGPWPMSALNVPIFHTAFETTAAVASGLVAAYRRRGMSDITVVGWAGDGGTFDIGIQALSGAAERRDDFIYVCYDNEAYMNTGIQRSGGTPYGAWTSTTPLPNPKGETKKDIDMIMAAHRVAYQATCTPAYPEDMLKKFRKARNICGTRFIHILSACPPGWRSAENRSVELMRLAVHSNIFPLFEAEYGEKFRQTVVPEKVIPVKEYMKFQGRFRHLSEKELKLIQEQVDARFAMLKEKFGKTGKSGKNK